MMSGSLLVAAACLFVYTGLCSAHLCLITPIQRQSFNQTSLDKRGSDDCFIVKGPCGGKPKETPIIVLSPGYNFTTIFQKNLDHFYAKSPGYFSVTLWSWNMKTSKEVARVADSNTHSLFLYKVTFNVPKDMFKDHCILQVQYMTKNPTAPATFYQCADVFVTDDDYTPK